MTILSSPGRKVTYKSNFIDAQVWRKLRRSGGRMRHRRAAPQVAAEKKKLERSGTLLLFSNYTTELLLWPRK